MALTPDSTDSYFAFNGGMAVEDTLSYVDRLYASSNRIDGLYYMAARALGISENMLSLLYALLDGRPRSQKQICEELLIPKTTLNTVTRECLAAGHISLGEGKEKLIELTPSGREYAEGLLSGMCLAEREAMDLTMEEFGTGFVGAVESFTEHLREEFERHIFNREGT